MPYRESLWLGDKGIRRTYPGWILAGTDSPLP